MTDFEKLKRIISEIDVLISHNVRSSDPEFQAWRTKAEKLLTIRYGEGSMEHKQFVNTTFSPVVWFGSDMESEKRCAIKLCCDGLKTCKAIFETYLEDMSDVNEDALQISNRIKSHNMDKVFIVHGHDGELKQTVARIVEKQGIEAILLSEQANQGRTIIEKFEDFSDVDGAICLFTSDDVGRSKLESTYKPRARQNVVLETGYFMGKLGRNHVVILTDDGIEMPSDLSGIVHTATTNWQVDLLKELSAIGYTIDFNKLFD